MRNAGEVSQRAEPPGRRDRCGVPIGACSLRPAPLTWSPRCQLPAGGEMGADGKDGVYEVEQILRCVASPVQSLVRVERADFSAEPTVGGSGHGLCLRVAPRWWCH